jgi:hypothetical protein
MRPRRRSGFRTLDVPRWIAKRRAMDAVVVIVGDKKLLLMMLMV